MSVSHLGLVDEQKGRGGHGVESDSGWKRGHLDASACGHRSLKMFGLTALTEG